jgi:hypothetical protein
LDRWGRKDRTALKEWKASKARQETKVGKGHKANQERQSELSAASTILTNCQRKASLVMDGLSAPTCGFGLVKRRLPDRGWMLDVCKGRLENAASWATKASAVHKGQQGHKDQSVKRGRWGRRDWKAQKARKDSTDCKDHRVRKAIQVHRCASLAHFLAWTHLTKRIQKGSLVMATLSAVICMSGTVRDGKTSAGSKDRQESKDRQGQTVLKDRKV